MELQIEYLDLAIPNNCKKITKLEQFRHKCYFNKTNTNFHHELHSDNAQLNTIIDLLVSLGINLGKYGNHLTSL